MNNLAAQTLNVLVRYPPSTAVRSLAQRYATLRYLAKPRIAVFALRSCVVLAVFFLAASVSHAQKFDLSGLPEYASVRTEATSHCHGAVCTGEWGVIRIQGTELTQALIDRWQSNFLKRNPNIRFSDYFMPNGFAGLTTGTYDVNVIGHSAWRSDIRAFQAAYGHDPLEIMFATGGFDKRVGNTPAPIFIVNKDNPVAGLTLRQLDGIFGAERTGGWTRGYVWTTRSARGANENIRTWGQLGLTGDWADKPIHLVGYDATLSNWSDLIQRVVFRGGDKWNPAMREMVRGGSQAPADKQIVNAVAEDRYAIGFNLMRVIEKEPRVKPISVAVDESGEYIQPTEESVYRRTYPLSNAVYIYINRAQNKSISPRLKEFLTYILSREGQQDVADEGMFLPLNPEAAREQLAKINLN